MCSSDLISFDHLQSILYLINNDPCHIININYNLCSANDFTCTENMCLENGFCEWISNHLTCRKIFQDHILWGNHISYKIILGIYMFSFSMIFEVIYISNDSLTVTIDCCWPKNNLDYSQALQKSSQPYNFLYCN